MKIAKNTVVRVSLLIRDEEGRVLESGEAEDKGPLDYVHGAGFLLQSVEEALEGREEGEEIEVRLPPDKAFGYRNERLKKRVSPALFGDSGIPLWIGETVLLDEKEGLPDERECIEWMITEIGDDYIGLDGNNPWAGKTLHVRAHVLQIRPATGRELWTGRAMSAEIEKAGIPDSAGSGPWGIECGPGCCCWGT